MSAKQNWSADKKEWLKKLWPKYVAYELSQNDMCKIFGCTSNTFRDHARLLNLPERSNSEINFDYLKKLGVPVEV